MESKNNAHQSRGENRRDFVLTAMQVAGVLGVISPGHHSNENDAAGENGGIHNLAGLQPAYRGYGEAEATNGPHIPVLHLPENQVLPDDIADLILDFPVNEVQPNGVQGVAFDVPALEQTQGDSASNAPPRSELNTPEPLFEMVSSDDDFQPAPARRPKHRSQEMPKTPQGTPPTPSVTPRKEVQGSGARVNNVEAGPSSTAAGPSTTKSKPTAEAPQTEKDDSVLRAMLVGESSLRGEKSQPKKTTKNPRVARRAPASRGIAKRKEVVASAAAVNITPEAGCSGVVLAAKPASNSGVASERITIQNSDSESEFEIFSQEEDRRLFKKFFKRRRQIEREYEAINETVRGAENSLAASEEDLRAVDANLERVREEIRRLEEERRRLEDQRQGIINNINNSRETLERHRGSLDRAAKKLKTLDKKK